MEICLEDSYLKQNACAICDIALDQGKPPLCVVCGRLGFEFTEGLNGIFLAPKSRLEKAIDLVIGFLEKHGYGVYKQSDLKPVPLTQLPPKQIPLKKQHRVKTDSVELKPDPLPPTQAEISEMAKTDPIIAAKLKELESLQQKGGFKP